MSKNHANAMLSMSSQSGLRKKILITTSLVESMCQRATSRSDQEKKPQDRELERRRQSHADAIMLEALAQDPHVLLPPLTIEDYL